MFDALCQPAPHLCVFDITSWQSSTPVCIPPDIFAHYAQQLMVLVLGDGVHLPSQPVSGFRSVETLAFLLRSGDADLTTIFEWFPNLRHLATCAQQWTVDCLSRLTTQHLHRLSELESLGLHVSSLNNVQRLNAARHIIAQTRTLWLDVMILVYKPHGLRPPLAVSAAGMLLPHSSQELYSWIHSDGTLLGFPAVSLEPLFLRHVYALLDYQSTPIFVELITYRTLVALSIDIFLWERFREHADMLPALEVLLISLGQQLPRHSVSERLIHCPRLRIDDGPTTCGPVTCRNIDAFLRGTFAVGDWAAVEVFLLKTARCDFGSSNSCAMPVLSKPIAVELPNDIFDLIFDYLAIRHLVLASHASLTEATDCPAVDFFLTRLGQARLADRTLSVAVWPRGGLQKDHTRMSSMTTSVLPAISASMTLLHALHIEVPSTLSSDIFNALRQPAPALRTFTITNWDHNNSWVAVPADIFATDAPQLHSLCIGDGLNFPIEPIPGFRTVGSIRFLAGCSLLGLHRLGELLDWFPQLCDLKIPNLLHNFTPEELLRGLTGPHLERLRHFRSISLHASLYQAIRQLGEHNNFVATSRRVNVDFSLAHRDIRYKNIPSLVESLAPQSHRSAHCSLNSQRTDVLFEHPSSPPFVREFLSSMHPAGEVAWKALFAFVPLVSLYLDSQTLDTFLRAELSLPALGMFYLRLISHPHDRSHERGVASCPRLRSVIIEHESRGQLKRPMTGNAPITCRGVDRFLSTSLSVKTWADVEVILIGFLLFGPASVDGTQITGVTLSSRPECFERNPQLAALIRNAPSLHG
ncbi:hypothetical protein AURDEDRAFT_162811 [Auricularia subglabra TFB-10046 SS5]|nr:hypothetical protein AURDEDRAFT_162811 [Auricularia subglabra TFB-10046 SS5]